MTALDTPAAAPARQRFLGNPVPPEGEGGLFSETWYPICLSSEVAVGEVRGEDFLDGRVVVFRGANGVARVMSAYCPHVGADLSVGDVQGNTLRCGFHHWGYDQDGVCVKTGCGDEPPSRARLYAFPTAEKYGVIWAFNGDTPTFAFPEFPYPEEELVIKNVRTDDWTCDPWVLSANTPDVQHLRSLHGITFDEDPEDVIEFNEHSMTYDFKGALPTGDRIEFWLGVWGTNLFYQHATFNGRWFGWYVPFTIPRPGQSRLFPIVAIRKADGDDAANAEFLEAIWQMEWGLVQEDISILNTIHYRPGTMTKTDRALGRFLAYVRQFPRTHPSADFIR